LIKENIHCLDISPPEEGTKVSRFLCVGTDQLSVYVLSLGNSLWFIVSRYISKFQISYLSFWNFKGIGSILYIGHLNVVLSRMNFNNSSGEIGIPQMNYLDQINIDLIKTEHFLIAVSSSIWILKEHFLQQISSPLFRSINTLFADFSSQECLIVNNKRVNMSQTKQTWTQWIELEHDLRISWLNNNIVPLLIMTYNQRRDMLI
jgi:hypothetical protein